MTEETRDEIQALLSEIRELVRQICDKLDARHGGAD